MAATSLILLVQILLIITIVLFTIVLSHLAINNSLKKLSNHKHHHKSDITRLFLKSIRTPSKLFILLIGYNIIIKIITGSHAIAILPSWLNFLEKTKEILIILTVLLTILKIVSNLEVYLLRFKTDSISIDKTSIDIFAKIFSVIAISIAILFLMHVFGVNTSTIIAFGGISTAVVAFATRDLFSSMISTLLLYFDRPFVVGDYIKIFDRRIMPLVEGSVEKINWRFTQIRVRNMKIVSIPNTYLIAATIENASRASYYGVFFNILIQSRSNSLTDAKICIAKLKDKLMEINKLSQIEIDILNINGGIVRMRINFTSPRNPEYPLTSDLKKIIVEKIEKMLRDSSLKFEIDFTE